jgi:metabolite-proton symporter
MPIANSTRERRALLEAIVASTVGTTIEWYDFFLYGTAAALVFPDLFFPDFDPFSGQLASFGTFTIGFVARPFGGIIFGHLGDRIGRKATLVSTLLLMGSSTFLIGVLPTYERAGILAPLLLTVLRVLQGIGVGGEWGGAVLLALESGHRGRRGLYASWPQAGVPLGLLTSTGVVALFEWLLSKEDFLVWGWRVPFFLSALLVVVGLLIRTRIGETPLFRQLQQDDRVARAPVVEVVRGHWREILLGAGARLVENACFYLFTIHILAYATKELKIEPGRVLMAINLAAAIEFFTIPLYGALSDHTSRRGVYVAGCLFLIVFAWPFYELLATCSTGWILVAVVLALAGGHAALYGVQGALIPELFGTRLRYSGASISYQLAAPVAGGLAPLIATALTKQFPGQRWPLAGYIALLSIISLVCVLRLSETSRRSLQEHNA